MAATYTDNGGNVNGSNKVFTYSFPVLQTEDIQVALNGVTQAQNRYTPSLTPANITFDNNQGVDSTVQEADGAPKNGVTVRVYRKTKVGKTDGNEDPKAVFAAGSSIRAGDLNANIEQALFGIHEQQEKKIQTEDLSDDAVTSAKLDTNIDIAGTLDVTGATTLDSTLSVANNATVGGTLGVTGTTTAAAINASGAVNATGNLAINTNKFNVNATSGDTTIAGTLGVTGNASFTQVLANGAYIDNVYIGINDANEIDTSSGNLTLDSAGGTVIVDDHLTVNGTITGNVTGNLTGNVTGNVSGSAGSVSGNAATATALATGRTLASTGDVVWNSGSFDGTANKTAAATIQADAVTYAKMQNVSATDRVLGRDSSGAGVVEEITPTNLRTMINVEDGATADQSNAEIRAAVEAATDSNVFTDDDHSRLDALALTTKGTIAVGDGAGQPTILSVGANNYVLVADSNEASGVKWATVPAGSGLSNVVEDTTPQLGGALDVQAQEINTSTTNGNIKLTPNGTGVVEVKGNTNPGTLQLNCENNSHSVKIKGPAHSAAASYTLTLPDDDGTVDQVLKTDGSGNLSWGANVVIWTLGINGGADAFTFTGPGFASATDDPTLYLSRGQTYKFINGNSSGTHAFNIEKSDHDATWSAYTTGMTGAGATGGNTMTWTVPMDAPSLLRYKSGTTAAMTGFIQVTDGTNTNEGFICSTGSRVSGLEINNGPNGSHMAFFGTHPTGYQPTIIGETSTTTTFQSAAGYDFDSGNINLQSYGTNTTTPATIKFEGGGSNNTYGPTISGPATAQATSNYTITLPGVVPTSNGQVLSATTAGVCSWADQSSGTITALNNQTADRLTTIGATTTELDGEASLTFNDAATTGLISGRQITGRGFECPATVSDDWTIAAGNNAFFPGPMTVAANKTVTVPANRTLTIV